MDNYELKSYAVSLIAGVAEREAALRPVATIHVRPRGKKHRNVNIYLRFYRSDTPVPPNQCIGDEEPTYMVHYRFDQLANAVDLLRNGTARFLPLRSHLTHRLRVHRRRTGGRRRERTERQRVPAPGAA